MNRPVIVQRQACKECICNINDRSLILVHSASPAPKAQRFALYAFVILLILENIGRLSLDVESLMTNDI